jgi:large subunit ribosomal protein L15
MKYNELQLTRHKTTKRLGRGIASGKGKTAARGTKGYGARTGSKKRPGFRGGELPMMQQLPKLPGFNSLHAKMENVHLGQLEQFGGKVVDTALLAEHKLISSPYTRVKLLVGKGDLTKKITVKLQAASKTAVAALEAAGGSFEAVARAQRPASKKKTDKKH